MGVMIDIIGSTIIRGAIVLVILNLNISLNNALSDKTVRAALKQKTVVPAQILTDDIRLAGYGPTTSKKFYKAQLSEIEFDAVLNPVDTYDPDPYLGVHTDPAPSRVHYYLGAAGPEIPPHRVLYRQLNGGAPFELARDVVSLTFTYYNSVGNTIAAGNDKLGIKSISIKLKIASNAQVIEGIGTDNTAKYETAYWERTIFPQNL